MGPVEFIELVGAVVGQLVVIAVTTEALVEVIKMAIPFQLEKKHDQLIALAVAMILAFTPIFSVTGISVKAMVAVRVLVGVLASRGSNFAHDLLNIVNGLATQLKEAAQKASGK